MGLPQRREFFDSEPYEYLRIGEQSLAWFTWFPYEIVSKGGAVLWDA
jgi:hypothetical protein